jgi:hypothetical protein
MLPPCDLILLQPSVSPLRADDILEAVNYRIRQSENACGLFAEAFQMILEIAAALLLIHSLRMLSRLLARRRDMSCYDSKSLHSPRRASRWAHAARAQYPAASLGFQVRFADDKPSRFFYWEDQPLSSPSVRTDQRAGESVYTLGMGSMSCKPPGPHQHEWPAGRIFRPRKRQPLGLQINP